MDVRFLRQLSSFILPLLLFPSQEVHGAFPEFQLDVHGQLFREPIPTLPFMRQQLPALESISLGSDALWWSGFGIPSIDGQVHCAVIWNGDLIIGGQFYQAGGVPASNIARWDGESWTPLGDGMDEVVLALTTHGQDLIAGGRFTRAGQAQATGVARWDGAGWHAMGSGLEPEYAYELPHTASLTTYRGDLIATGSFTRSGSTRVRRIARWNDGQWSSLGEGLSGTGLALAVHANDLFVGGVFDSAGVVEASSLAKWDGTEWSGVTGGVVHGPAVGTVNALAVHQSRLYVGGEFDAAGPIQTRNIASWIEGVWDSLGGGVGYRATAMASHQDSLYVGIGLGSMGVLNWSGSSWRWTAPMEFGVPECLLSAGEDLIVGGSFRTDAPANSPMEGFNVARWTDQSWRGYETWNERMRGLTSWSGTYVNVTALAAFQGDLVVGGGLKYAGEPPVRIEVGPVAAWNGTSWYSLGYDSDLAYVHNLFPVGETLYATGLFYNSWYGFTPSPASRFDGSSWSPMDTLSSMGSCLAMYRGSLYLGTYRSASNLPFQSGLYVWEDDHWRQVGLAEDSSSPFPGVTSLMVKDDKLIVGGRFHRIGGIDAFNIATWDGQAWAPMGQGLPSLWWPVFGLTTWQDKVVAAGNFIDPAGSASVVTWNGSTWERLGELEGTAYCVATVGNGLFTGGWFGRVRQHVQGLYTWDGDRWASLGSGVNGPVHSILEHQGALWVGGEFSLAGLKSSFGIARWDGLAGTSEGPTFMPAAPNPFRYSTVFSYSLPRSGPVDIAVFDVHGRKVKVLEDGNRDSGRYAVTWDAKDRNGRVVPGGVYFIRAVLPRDVRVSRKVIRVP